MAFYYRRFFFRLSMPLKILKAGSIIFNIELHHKKGSALCRSAGSFGIILSQFRTQTKKKKKTNNFESNF